MPNKKFAFIHPFQLRLQRGIEVWLWYLSYNLAKQGMEVHILTWDGELEVPVFYHHPNLSIKRIPKYRYFQSWWAVPFYLLYLFRYRYDHIIVNFAGYGEGLALSICRLFMKCSFSLVLHFPNSLVPHRYEEFKYWRFHKKADHIIAVSQTVADEASALFGRDCEVVGHGVDGDHFCPDPEVKEKMRSALGIPMDVFVLVSVSALEERKGIQWVIEAMPYILSEASDVMYLIIGKGPYQAKLERLVHSLRLEENVKFLGHQRDVVQFYQMGDLMVLLSHGEASPVSVPEALACGLPILTSNSPPFPEIIHSSFGVMVDAQNVKAVSNVVLKLKENTNNRVAMQENARAWALENHNWDVIAKKYLYIVD